MTSTGERALETRLGVAFRDPALLGLALTHGSLLHERPGAGESNERLEFLGDAFLSLIIGEEVYRRFPDAPEGRLTQMRSRLVRAETLAGIASRLGVGACLRLGRGEEQSGGRARQRNLAGALEAIFGALLLDQGHERARRLVLSLFEGLLASLPGEGVKDYKSLLQENVQGKGRPTPLSRTVGEEGTGGDRVFTVEVSVGGEVVGTGAGGSKRKAEQEAARAALATFGAQRAEGRT